MPMAQKITHMFEPTPLQCGQAVLSMLSGEPIDKIISIVKTERETTLADMKNALRVLGIGFCDIRLPVCDKSKLPKTAILSLETPHCWHWSLYRNGKFYDPEYGLLDDFPPSNRRYYWEITEDE